VLLFPFGPLAGKEKYRCDLYAANERGERAVKKLII
jgi:hypothetical protein